MKTKVKTKVKTVSDAALITHARAVVNPRRLSESVEVGSVGSALVTDKGNVYTGICIDTACSMGFCAEHNAIGNMVTNGESAITSIVAVNRKGKVIPPCGRCREFICQMDDKNAQTRVLLDAGRVLTIRELLPAHWKL